MASVRIAPPRPRIGEQVRIEVTLAHEGRRPVDVLVDLAIHFVKARGSTSRRVFKLRALHLAPGERATLGKRISLAQHTTRTTPAPTPSSSCSAARSTRPAPSTSSRRAATPAPDPPPSTVQSATQGPSTPPLRDRPIHHDA